MNQDSGNYFIMTFNPATGHPMKVDYVAYKTKEEAETAMKELQKIHEFSMNVGKI